MSGNYCVGFQCTITANLGGSLLTTMAPWTFDVVGALNLDTNTGNLTGTPQAPALIGTLSTTLSPSFSVVAADYPIGQALADAAASATATALNSADVEVDVSGAGYWTSIDLPNISAILNESGDTAELGLTIADAVLKGYFEYELDVTFANSIVDFVGGTFISFLESTIHDMMTNQLINSFTNLDGETDLFSFICTGSRRTSTSVNVECLVDMNLLLSGATPPREPGEVSAPAMTRILTLGVIGLMAARRRRSNPGARA